MKLNLKKLFNRSPKEETPAPSDLPIKEASKNTAEEGRYLDEVKYYIFIPRPWKLGWCTFHGERMVYCGFASSTDFMTKPQYWRGFCGIQFEVGRFEDALRQLSIFKGPLKEISMEEFGHKEWLKPYRVYLMDGLTLDDLKIAVPVKE
jgi:hypothetical protein